MSDVPDRLAHLSPAKRFLLQKLRREQAGSAARPIGRRAAEPGAAVPLSFAQQRLWFIHQMDPGSAAYHLSYPLRLRGEPDVPTLERSLGSLVERHESLRTVFGVEEGVPVQTVLPPARQRIPVADLRALAEDAREGAVRLLLDREARRPFDLARGPLLRVLLARLAHREWALCFTLHHIVSDGWSLGVLVREVNELYRAHGRGEPPTGRLPELPIQYADYAVWQREQLAGAALEAQLRYWRDRLAGAPPLLELPTDFPRRAADAAPAGVRRVALPEAASGALRELAQREGATVFMALLAVWQLLLARYAGTDDVSVGTAVAGRTRRELEGLIGFFVNTLVLRGDLSGDPTFRELLGRTREATLGAFSHQDVPFERLVEELAPERSLVHTPLFQVMFALQSAERGELRLGELALEPLAAAEAPALFDLSLDMADGPQGMAGALTYRADLFEPAAAERMAGHFRLLAEGVARDPDRPVSAVSLLDEAERRRLLVEWTAPREYATDRLVPRLVAEQAARTPGATAVSGGGLALTYAELEARSGRLAGALRRLGVGPETPVGLCLERGPELLVAVLGVWKAGGAYVPLDPGYPAERLGWMLADAAVPVLVSQEHLRATLPPHGAAVLLLDADAARIAAEGAETPAVEIAPEGLAYVIYTSGSTGRPKGVRVTHGSLLATLLAARAAFGFGPGDRMAALASFAFDIWLLEAVLPLLAGAEVRVLPSARVLETGELLGELEQGTALHAVPALMRRVAQALRDAERTLPGIRQAFVGGDAVPPDLLDEMRGAFPSAALRVLYGPTEATVICAVHEPRPGEARRTWIGRPLGNSALYVLDRALQPVPVGVPGELCIGGASVARDYLGRPDPTAEKWVPDPFSAAPGARLYRSGDRVRWTAAGSLEFLGRIDRQVKIRGFRVEPGETEAVLAGHPAVRDAVVVVRDDAPGAAGEKRLVAYLVADGAAPPAAELRTHLAASLPDYMLPSAFVALDAFPLTPSGKVDRGALPAPEAAAPDEAGDRPAPRTTAEEMVAGIWAEVLGLAPERMGAEDDFFALGGHSLLATRAVSRLREAFGVEVPLRAIFEAPTVAGLAARVDDLLRTGTGLRLPPLVPVPRDGSPLPLSFAQQRLWFIHQLDPASPAYNMPSPLRLRGRLRPAVLRRALTELVRRHESLRTVFRAVGGEPVQVVRPAGPAALPLADLRGLRGEAREDALLRLAREEAARPFDLERGPLLRALLLRAGEEDWGLLFTMHHVVSDGWSMGVLVREVSALYGAFAAGSPSPLPEPRVQYADYAVWQRGWLRGETLERQLGYWRERLAGAPPLLEVPTDRPRPQVAGERAGQLPLALSPETSQALRALSRREGATLFMTLLAAWQALLGRYAGQDDVVVGTPLAGRGHLELEGLIGFFVNTLVLRTDLSGRPTFRELVRRAREATLGAQAHQDLPFERLVDELKVERSLDRAPLFQALFALQAAGAADERLSLGGVEVYPLSPGEAAAKYDLALTLEDGGDRLAGTLAYRADLWEGPTMERMLRHFQALVERVAAEPDLPVAEVDLLAPAERARLLEAGRTPRDYPRGCIHELFAEQARRTPGAAALRFAGQGLTYAELDDHSDRLARLLRERGVGPEVAVGVCLPRTPAMVVALLAALKAGGAYLPLDPQYPRERLGWMLEDSGARLVLSLSAFADRLPEGAEPVFLDRVEEELRGLPSGPPESGVLPENLSHVIFTSGSTGRPKGVMVRHEGAVVLLHWLRETLTDAERAAVLGSSSISFDASVAEVFGTLCWGGTLYLVENALELATLPEREEVRYAAMVPTAAAELLRAGGIPRGLRTLTLAGEALPHPLAQALHALGTLERIGNGYGPTEDTTYSAFGWVPAGAERVTLGRPVANTHAYVLDAELHPVPVGVVGELYLGGAGLARGYAGRPDLTAERFLPDPFGAPGSRAYRVMDRVRWLPDGELEYFGRTDFQVKVRGFRIELGEVEAALERHEGVHRAVAVVRDDAAGDRRIVAYVVPASGEPGAAELRAHLRRFLPEHMVPSAFVPLEELPLTGSGKVDRRALPAPEPGGDAPYAAPRTPAEEALCGIWAEVLGRARVGVHDNYFELGGHSLMAARLVSRVREALGVEMPLRTVFEAPTVAQLAEWVEAQLPESQLEAWEVEEAEAMLADLSDEEVRRMLEEP